MSCLDAHDTARSWIAEMAESLLPEFANTLPQVYVWQAERERVYGGPEEGGWWYTQWSPIATPKYPMGTWQSMSPDKASKFCNEANNTEERGFSTLRVVWVWTFDPPCVYPKEKPHYE